jgi:hypothetical protein
VAGAQLRLQLLGLADCVRPGRVGGVHSIDQILPCAGSPVSPARKRTEKLGSGKSASNAVSLDGDEESGETFTS